MIAALNVERTASAVTQDQTNVYSVVRIQNCKAESACVKMVTSWTLILRFASHVMNHARLVILQKSARPVHLISNWAIRSVYSVVADNSSLVTNVSVRNPILKMI